LRTSEPHNTALNRGLEEGKRKYAIWPQKSHIFPKKSPIFVRGRQMEECVSERGISEGKCYIFEKQPYNSAEEHYMAAKEP